MLVQSYRRRRTQEQAPDLPVVERNCSIVFRCNQGQAGTSPGGWGLTSGSESKNRLRSNRLVLEVQDRLLLEVDLKSLFPLQSDDSGNTICFVENLVVLCCVWSQEIVVSDPERGIIVRTVVRRG